MNDTTPKKFTSHQIEQKNIAKALTDGVVRQERVQAEPDQLLTYILARHKQFHHATLESASNERYFLQAALGRRVRIFKIWNVGRKQIKNDFYMLRAMLDETEHWDPAYNALDRVRILIFVS